MKQKVVELLVLAFPIFNKVVQVKCYTSGSSVGDVLSQEGKPIAFISGKLNDSKKKYFVYYQEFYVVVQALNKWRHYFIPKEFVLYIDHKPL